MLKDNLCQDREYKFKSINTGPYPKEEKDLRIKIEVEHTKRIVSQTAHYIMDLYQEQLEDMEDGQVLRHLDPSVNSIIFKKIEGMKVEELEGAMNIYAELMIDAETQPETELLKLIMVYRYMLKTIVREATNIEIIKIDLQNKIWEQLESNRDQEEDPMTGSQFREKQHEGGDLVIDNLVPPKLDSGQPTQGLTQGLKSPH